MKPINFFPKFNALTPYDLNVDMHLHSTWTDGKNTVAEIAKKANDIGLHSISITDHIRKDSTYFNDYKKEINLLNEQDDLNIYVGFEAKVEDFIGNIDVKQECIKVADIVILSVHRYPLGRKLYHASDFKKDIAQEIELELALAALKKGGFNVLGHPGGMSLTHHKAFPKSFFEEIIIECKRNEIAFDFSGRYHGSEIDIIFPLLKKHNPYVSIGSDSHSISPMGEWRKILENYIK